MGAIFKRELKSYFYSPLGYVVIGLFMSLCSVVFLVYVIMQNTSELSGYFSTFMLFLFIMISILSMKFFSEEFKNKTDQLLLTAPVSLTETVLGKFFAALVVMLMAIATSFILIIIVVVFGTPDWGSIFCSYFGLILLTMALISIGIFISSLTKSQLVCSILTFVVLLVTILASGVQSYAAEYIETLPAFFQTVLTGFLNIISIYNAYVTFSTGIFSFAGIVYYISLTAIFLFLTVRVLERKRWH